MKSTVVDANGSVRCPVCGAADFSDKRTGRAKWGAGIAGAVTLGLAAPAAIAAMPKRLKCRGCGENLKRGDAPKTAPVIDSEGQPRDGWAERPRSARGQRPPRSAFRKQPDASTTRKRDSLRTARRRPEGPGDSGAQDGVLDERRGNVGAR